ncbi:MAG TPA: DUF4389 domain-containing protein [Candidatus Nanoarchaeia archaeon]|uniref:DUF4389 domain-containing protein n=1 Tax=uncultured archaeon Rifle_16ft_4_minimus_37913 TaxID=1665152 RepID=A0A0H4T964_9ARCH|nr:hypothetical protein [uncultured archaeon Rifle_16ft_4_minimus_37913]HKZ33946.1 DUF4389 domain-containing protein [Candidatus Nanoarchaeia archaeon]
MKRNKKGAERKEALMRILILIVSGTILTVWRIFIYLIIFMQLVYVLITGRRMRNLAVWGETWNTQWYIFQKYIIFLDNRRPFPFGKLEKNMDEFEK